VNTSTAALIVTLVVSRAVFEILTHKARKYHVFPIPPLFEFGQSGNSAIRSADPGTLSYNQTWSKSDAPFKLYCDLETGIRSHSRSSKAVQFDRAHTTLYLSSMVNKDYHSKYASIYYRFRDIAAYLSKIASPFPCIRGGAVRFTQHPWWRQN